MRTALTQSQKNKLALLVVFLLLGWWILLMRLFDIQVLRGQAFREQADQNRYFTRRLPPERGVFFDRYGQLLTWNQRRYFKVQDPSAIQAQLSALDKAEALLLMATESGRVQYGLKRQYLQPEAMAHTLGYVGPVTVEDLLADGSLAVSDQVGKTGLEVQFDKRLQGQAGEEVYEINALGQQQRLVQKKAGQAGQNFTTSLDPTLSEVAYQALADQVGSVVMMDAATGEILALVNRPSFDLNLLANQAAGAAAQQKRQVQLESLFNDERRVFFNRAISGAYPPGSVFKLVTALSGLETDSIDQETTVLDEGILRVGEYEYKNWYYSQYGRTEGELSLVRALARSNDIFFYKVAEWIGPNKLAEFARLLGLGQATGIELGSEVAGLVPDPSWKEQELGEPWYLGNTFHLGIGQGNLLMSPLQVAQMTQAVVNQGQLCPAHLVAEEGGGQRCAELGLKEEHLDLVLQGMLEACSVGGTAWPFFSHNQAAEEGGRVFCKTGTAEFGGQDEQGYRRTHAWLTAIVETGQIQALAEAAPATSSAKPVFNAWQQVLQKKKLPKELIITVLVESDENEPFKEGSDHATPVAKEIVDWMYGS